MNHEDAGSNYQPISCASYEEYEMAILHGRKMQMTWQTEGVVHNQVVTPLDLRTANGEEYLRVRLAGGAQAEIRLDHIKRSHLA